MCDLYTLKFEQVKQHFGYMVYSRDDYQRFKRIYTNAANLRSQVITLYQDTHVCDYWRQKTAYDNLSKAVNDDIRYFDLTTELCVEPYNGTLRGTCE